MRKTHFTLLLTACLSLKSMAGDWMSRLPDHLFLSQVSIPGTHDSATGNGVTLATFSQCQDIDVASQWSIGIRAFDFRPRVKGGNYLNINHGVSETKLRFDDALYLLRDSLRAHPTEFAVIHCLYATSYDKEKDEYVTLLRELLSREDLKDYFVPFRRDLTVGDMRGKILLLSRDQYASKPITGGFFQNWCGWLDWNAQTKCGIIGMNSLLDSKCTLCVQDYANTKDNEGGVQTKVDAVTQMLDYSTKHVTDDKSKVVWVFNFASAYHGSLSTANSYRENATHTNAAIIEYLKTHDAGPTGVVLMDYCVDRSPNEKDGKYLTRGRELVDTWIENNFKWLTLRNQKAFDKALERINLLYGRIDAVRELLATDCSDVAVDFYGRLDEAKLGVDAVLAEAEQKRDGWLLTESYTVDYTGNLRIINKILSDARDAQTDYNNVNGVQTVYKDGAGKEYRVYSVSGKQLNAPRPGAVNILKYLDGTVRKVRF